MIFSELWKKDVLFICPLQDYNVLFSSFTVVSALIALINEPEPEHPLRADLAEEFTKNKKDFMKHAEEHTKKFSEKRPAD